LALPVATADHEGMVAAVTRTLALLATATALVAAPAAARADGSPAAPGAAADPAALEGAGVRDIVVERRPGLDRDDRAQLRADADVRLEQTLTLPETEVVRAAPGGLTEALAALEADPDVVYAEPDAPVYATSSDARFAEQWSLRNTGQAILGRTGLADADIDAPEAWSLGATGAGVTVAVVDTGIALTHPDLAGQIATNPGETGGGREANNVDDDHDGYVDDWRGWDFVAGDNLPADENGHGTHVSGTIAAAQDAVGVTGVAPGARILPLRVLNASGSGTASAVASAFDLAGRLGIPVVNASLGSSGLSTAQRTAINAHPNTLYVVAAGNDGHDNDTTPTYPCVIPAANIVCVGATDNRDARASFSNVGRTSVDLFAPGVSVLSSYGTGYGYMDGTSMATPHVAGALALMRQAAPTLNAAQLKQGLLDGAEPKPALDGLAVTGARLNAANAIQVVRSVTGLPALVPYDPTPAQPAATPAPTPTAPAPRPAPVPAKPQPKPTPRRSTTRIAPRLSGLVAAPATAIVCRTGTSACHGRAAQLRYRADRAATVTAQVQRRSCTGAGCAYRTTTTITLSAAAGSNRLAIGAHGATARLAAGAYRVRLTAADDAGRSAPVAHAVTVERA
jgi:subtilisin family serine protease